LDGQAHQRHEHDDAGHDAAPVTVRDKSKVWSSYRVASSGSTTVEFSGVAWYGYHSRPVSECPVYFGFIGFGFIGVCSSTRI
jgi:hypothetical protein